MTGKSLSSPSKSGKGNTPNKKVHSAKSPSSKKSKDVSSSSVPTTSEPDVSWEDNAADSNGNVTLNLEIPNGGWDGESSSDNDSSFNLEIVEDPKTPLSGKRSRKRLRSEVSAQDNDILDGMEEEIERQLEAKAERNKLSVLNVKNILRQVITHPHVLAMVKRSARDGNCTVSGDNDEFNYEPKLTRAKAKELLEKVKDVDWPLTSCKKPVVSEFEALAMQELAEDSDDEEYHPGDETSDNECSEKDNSELDASRDQSPACIEADDVINSTPCTPDSTADRSITAWSEDGVFKIPMTPLENVKDGISTQEEVIARRTRSKLSLSDTPLEEIEKSFVPPDVPPGYYDSNLNDTTGDNDDWHEFLKEFMEPLPSDNQATEINDDDEADPEYNVLAEEEVVDKEELRMDRAVKVSRREVNALLAELFEYTENMSSEEDDAGDATISNIIYSSSQHTHNMDATVTSTGAEMAVGHDGTLSNNTGPAETSLVDCRNKGAREKHVAEDGSNNFNKVTSGDVATSDDSVSNPTCLFSLPQRLLLDQQIRQHVQLLTQHYLLTYDHPVYEKCASEVMNLLEEIRDKAKDSHPMSPYRPANLPAAFEVIEDWKRIMQSEKGECIKAFMERQIEQWHLSMLKRVARFKGKLPPELMELMAKSVAFVTPQLLPEVPFKCKISKLISYVPSEIVLISLGLEEFTEFVVSNTNLESTKKFSHQQALQYVSHYLIPTKDSDQLAAFIRKERKKLNSPIKYFYDHERAPATVHYIYPNLLLSPNQQPSYLLPKNWRDFLYPASV